MAIDNNDIIVNLDVESQGTIYENTFSDECKSSFELMFEEIKLDSKIEYESIIETIEYNTGKKMNDLSIPEKIFDPSVWFGCGIKGFASSMYRSGKYLGMGICSIPKDIKSLFKRPKKSLKSLLLSLPYGLVRSVYHLCKGTLYLVVGVTTGTALTIFYIVTAVTVCTLYVLSEVSFGISIDF